jgi:hypothetical protein
MATRHPVDETVAVFLNPLLPPKQPFSHRPFVTVTYAQSLDGKIAGAGGKQVAISCEESKRMTHTYVSSHCRGSALDDDEGVQTGRGADRQAGRRRQGGVPKNPRVAWCLSRSKPDVAAPTPSLIGFDPGTTASSSASRRFSMTILF